MANAKAIITAAAQRYGVRPDILWGLYGTESSFGKNPGTSSAGAVGPFQFLPSTAKEMGVDPYNFRSAAFGAAKYLSQYKSRGVGGMLSAYNAGPAGGYQSGYVNTTLQNAKSYGSGGGAQQPRQMIPGTPARTEEVPNPKAKGYEMLAKLVRSEGPESAPLASLIAQKAEPTTRTIPGTPERPAAPQMGGSKLGGFLPKSAKLELKRIDQGRDIQTSPGQALLAPGDGEVVAVKTDPSGFGPDYPVVTFRTGRLAGTTWYLGHTDTVLKRGESFRAGQPIARTSKTGRNAPPGWAEIGLASALGQGIHNQGAATRRYLGV
jgi:murein DD-endopeptidase MepM/ murein hydrolase activator NlpD